MNNITILIPLNEYNQVVDEFLKKALASIEKQNSLEVLPDVKIIFTSNIKEEITLIKSDTLKIEFVENTSDKTDFQSQINWGAKTVTTEYFSILEFDDEYSETYFKNVLKSIKTDPKTDIFLPILVEVNNENQLTKFTNELSWMQQYIGENGELGYLNQNVLNEYTDFKICGSVIKTQEFLNIGGLKSNIKLAFNYELFMRALNNGLRIYTIPKWGYKHLSSRENSLNDYYLKTMPIEERKYWFDVAKREFNFNSDRIIG